MHLNTKLPSVAVLYTDDGPGGPCGQDCQTTSSWNRIYLFFSEEDARNWIKNQKFPRRKRSRVNMCYLDQNLSGGISSIEYPKI